MRGAHSRSVTGLSGTLARSAPAILLLSGHEPEPSGCGKLRISPTPHLSQIRPECPGEQSTSLFPGVNLGPVSLSVARGARTGPLTPSLSGERSPQCLTGPLPQKLRWPLVGSQRRRGRGAPGGGGQERGRAPCSERPVSLLALLLGGGGKLVRHGPSVQGVLAEGGGGRLSPSAPRADLRPPPWPPHALLGAHPKMPPLRTHVRRPLGHLLAHGSHVSP